MAQISMTVNGTRRQGEVEPRLLLVYYLREVLGLTGTHVGCDTSTCGACTVMVDGRAVKSCTLFAVQAEDAEVLTIEGLARNGQLHPLQEGFWQEHGLQCGFCTPGMIMTALDLLQQSPNPSEEEIRKGLEGTLCRCTGYHNVVKAIRSASARMGRVSAGAVFGAMPPVGPAATPGRQPSPALPDQKPSTHVQEGR